MDQVKEAFDKVKQDIDSLKRGVNDLKKEFSEIQNLLLYLFKKIEKTQQNPNNSQNQTSTHNLQNQTNNQTSTHSSTHFLPFKSLKPINLNSSIGNEGVSTDRQTDRQTDNSTHFLPKIEQNQQVFQTTQIPIILPAPQDPYIVLEQLDSIKKELRFKIKRLTKQEMLVLSTIYQYEDQGKLIDYSALSQILNLSESSIRDYITRIIAKKIPIIKEKVNNKRIILHISPNLRKLASLNTLISLREL